MISAAAIYEVVVCLGFISVYTAHYAAVKCRSNS